MDSAVATMLCNGAVHPQSSGVGGGFFMTVYKKDTATTDTLVARERAPLVGTVEMYHGNHSLTFKVSTETTEVGLVYDEG